MNFSYSEKVEELRGRLLQFMDDFVYPNESVYESQLAAQEDRWSKIPPIKLELMQKAKEAGLWNLFLPESDRGAGLSNLEYAPLCEIMGRSIIGPEIFNCNAPDTGNMEVLERYGTEQHKKDWLEPLLEGKIRSAFSMTEPDVASSDATNIETSIVRDGDEYVINGHKWWSSGAGDPRTKISIVMGKTDPTAHRHEQQSMILVPMDTPGLTIKRMISTYGYDDAPHGHAEITYNDVRVPVSNILWEEGKGFAIAQGRLGPGRIHHCMRLIGAAERALELMTKRVQERVAFGKKLSEQGVIREWIAESRIEIEQARLLTLKAAYMMDTVGNKEAKQEIAMIKVVAPLMAQKVIDRAVQSFGAKGVSEDTMLPYLWVQARTLRLADGPDEVHKDQIARLELKKYDELFHVNKGGK